MIGKYFWVVGVFSCALLPGPASAEEIIEVTSCDPFDTEVGNGAEMVCVAPPDWMNDSGQPEDDPFDGPEGDEYIKGGKKTKTKKKTDRPPGGGNGSAEAKRKARCGACKKAGEQCVSQANAAGQSCMQSGANMATLRCSGPKLHGGDTPWGCGTFDIYDGECAGVEAPWNDKSRWEPGGESTQYNCEESWRLPHPAGSVTSSGTEGFSVSFKGVGVTNSTTITTTFNLTGQQGYQQACGAVGNQLWAACVGQQTKCLTTNSCEEGE